MEIVLLFMLSLTVNIIASTFRKVFADKISPSVTSSLLYISAIGLFALPVFFFAGGFHSLSSFTLWTGILYGLVTMLTLLFIMLATESGPYSYSMVLIMMSAVLPTLSGFFFWDQSLSVFQILGSVLMIISFFLSVNHSGKKKIKVKWLLYVLMAFLLNGSIGIMQAWQQHTEYKAEVNEYLIVGFVTFTLVGLIISLILLKIKGNDQTLISNFKAMGKKKFILWIILLCVVGGVVNGLNNIVNMYLAGVVDTAVMFPIVNGGAAILNSLVGLIFFRDKLTPKMWIGIGIGILSVVLVCL